MPEGFEGNAHPSRKHALPAEAGFGSTRKEAWSMNKCGSKKLLFFLSVCMVAVAGGSGLIYGGIAAAGGSGAAQTEEGAREPVRQIPPKGFEGFEVQKVGSRYEPVAHDYEAFRLPGTGMRFAAYTYLSPWDEETGVPTYGFLLDDGRFFYVNEEAAASGNPHYALSGSYFIVDGSAFEENSISRSMYLFRYDKHSARLLDMIGELYKDWAPSGFLSDYPGKPAYGHDLTGEGKDVPVWIITEKDHRGRPLIRLKMIRDIPLIARGPEEFECFHLYLRIVGGRLRVALDPWLYETLFDSVKEEGGPGSKPTEYYVSGFLAGKLSLARIKAELAGSKKRQWVVDILGHVKKWDWALHNRYWAPLPKMVEYKLNRG